MQHSAFHKLTRAQESAMSPFRIPAASTISPAPSNLSTSACSRSQIGIAATSAALPCSVKLSRRLLRSSGSGSTTTRPRRFSVFNAAVRVVRSIASSAATELIVAG